jgi:MT0933-like antitoxin protein
MGMLDKAKEMFSTGKDKAQDLTKENAPKMKDGIDKAAGFVKDKTGGKHDDQVDDLAVKAKGGVDKIAGRDGSTG